MFYFSGILSVKKNEKSATDLFRFVSQTLFFFLISFTQFEQIFNNQSLKSTPAENSESPHLYLTMALVTLENNFQWFFFICDHFIFDHL